MKTYMVPCFGVVLAESAADAQKKFEHVQEQTNLSQARNDVGLMQDESLDPTEYDPEKVEPLTITDVVLVPFRTGVEAALSALLKDAAHQINLVGQHLTTEREIPSKELDDAQDLDQRLDYPVGHPMCIEPAGECPECGALSYEVDNELNKAAEAERESYAKFKAQR